MIIQAITGQENFPNGTCKVHVFFSPSNDFPGEEKHIGVMVRNDPRNNHGFGQQGFPEQFNAAQGYKADLGKWTRANYVVPEGAVLKVFASRSAGQSRRSANQYIQVREGAALNRLVIATTGWAQGQFQSVSVEGRFDILTLAEATLLGVRTPPQYAHHFARTAVDALMNLQEIAPQRTARAAPVTESVVNSAGETVLLQNVRRRRALEV